jgi:hypothetical protein
MITVQSTIDETTMKAKVRRGDQRCSSVDLVAGGGTWVAVIGGFLGIAPVIEYWLSTCHPRLRTG